MSGSSSKMQDSRPDTKGKSCEFTSLLVRYHEKASVTPPMAAIITHGTYAEAKHTTVKLREVFRVGGTWWQSLRLSHSKPVS